MADNHKPSGDNTLPYYAPYNDQSQLLVTRPEPVNTTVITMAPRQPAQQNSATYDNCHLAWAIISLFCCQIFGIVATVMAILGYTDHRTGNYVNYGRKRRCAIGFLVTAILLGLVLIGCYAMWVYSYVSSEQQDTNADAGAHFNIDKNGLDAGVNVDTGKFHYN